MTQGCEYETASIPKYLGQLEQALADGKYLYLFDRCLELGDDTIIIETWIEKYNSLSVTFAQVIKSKATEKVFIKAQFDVVATSRAGKLYRKMPQMLTDAFEKGLEKCPALV